jgi:hypothetical protein
MEDTHVFLLNPVVFRKRARTNENEASSQMIPPTSQKLQHHTLCAAKENQRRQEECDLIIAQENTKLQIGFPWG